MPEEERRFRRRRRQLVKELRSQSITDERVLTAFGRVPRHEFVAAHQQEQAYDDRPLDIPEGQVITQPSLGAHMTQAAQVEASDKVLEVGTGSGYQAAILAELAGQVYTIERFESLAEQARRCLRALEYDNVVVRVGDGSKGWPEQAPFDVVMVTAGAAETPPQPLLDQLKPGGRLVIPVGSRVSQEVYLYRRQAQGAVRRKPIIGARFVPLVGKHGWDE